MPLSDKWSLKFDHCIKCGRNDLKHVSRGLCLSCYSKEAGKKYRGGRSKTRGEITDKLGYDYLFLEYITKERSTIDIAKENNCSRVFVHRKLLEYNIPPRNKREARKLVYDKHKMSYPIIDEAGKERIVTHKGFKIDEGFFKSWSKEMAYVLGIIYTDGNLYRDPIRKTYRILIVQKEPELLNKVIRLMNSDYSLRYRKQRGIAGAVYMIDLQHMGMFDDLLELGLTANKSLNMIFPDVPTQYMRHFIRGCWDGDGSVYITGGRIDANYTTGSNIFIEKLVQELYKVGIHKWDRGRFISDKSEVERLWLCYPDGKFPLTIHNKKGSNAFYIRLATKGNVERLFHFFYDDVDESMYLKRKYDVFVKGLSIGEKIEDEQLTLDLTF